MTITVQPSIWSLLEGALRHRRPMQIRYHDHDRTVFPHALGWKDGHAKVLVYQSAGTTSAGALPADPRQRWRSLFVDQIQHATIVPGPWETADNYSCATRRFALSPAQRGEIGGDISGSDGLPDLERG